MITSYGMWENDIGRPMEYVSENRILMLASAATYADASHEMQVLPECMCLASFSKGENDLTACSETTRTCHPYHFNGWESFAFCRSYDKDNIECGGDILTSDVVDVISEVKRIYAHDRCKKFQFPSRKVYVDEEVVDKPKRTYRVSKVGKPLVFYQEILNRFSNITSLRDPHAKKYAMTLDDEEDADRNSCTYCKGFDARLNMWCLKNEWVSRTHRLPHYLGGAIQS
uniref:Uncharacterized protein n=1 Tax=Polyblepharides amylifera TaxID=1486889 RepID=A0A7R9XN53_9CHLO